MVSALDGVGELRVSAGLVFSFSHVFMVSALTGDGVGELRVSAGFFCFSHVFMVSALDGVGELRVSAGF